MAGRIRESLSVLNEGPVMERSQSGGSLSKASGEGFAEGSHVHIAMLKESKLRVSDRVVNGVWSRRHVKWVSLDAVGTAGGLLVMWDTQSVAVLNSWKGDFSLSVLVEDLRNSAKWLLTSLYGPNSSEKRKEFWNELDMIRRRWNGPWCIGGDWNIIRFPSEKLGGTRISADMRLFSDWINPHSLVDLQLKGASFTWSNHQSNPAMSRLDRFLVTTDWLEAYPEVIQLALPKPASDHCPILLDSECER